MGKQIWYGILIFLAVVAVMFVIGNVGLGFKAWFNPKEVAIERKTFEQSQSHVEGMIRDLSNFRLQYVDPNTSEAQKAVIKATVQHQFADFPRSRIPDELKGFYNEMFGY